MSSTRREYLPLLLLSATAHVVVLLAVFLLGNINLSRPPQVELAIQAEVVIDTSELERRAAEQQRQQEEAARRAAAERRAVAERQAAEQRAAEERVAEQQRQREVAERQAQAAREREREQAEARREQERQAAERQAAEERRQREAAEQRAAEERRQREEAERRAAEERRQAEERRVQEAQARRERELAAQLREEEADRMARSSGEMAVYVAQIRNRIERNWNRPPSARPGLDCIVNVTQIPGGEVVDVRIGTCNGDDAVRRSIEAAVRRASPLPTPDNPRLFSRAIEFRFQPED